MNEEQEKLLKRELVTLALFINEASGSYHEALRALIEKAEELEGLTAEDHESCLDCSGDEEPASEQDLGPEFEVAGDFGGCSSLSEDDGQERFIDTAPRAVGEQPAGQEDRIRLWE